MDYFPIGTRALLKSEEQVSQPSNSLTLFVGTELELEFTLTVVGTGGDKLIYMQALNREDFDRWVKIFVERTGLPVFDANQQVMPKYKSKGRIYFRRSGWRRRAQPLSSEGA